jgi:hypothetical protein
MANVAHSTLTGSNLHEPKGVAAATANTVYVADGAGSGAWDTLPRAGLDTDAKTSLVLLATASPSSTASVTFTSGFSSDYSKVIFDIRNLLPATSGAELLFQVSTDGGNNYATTGYTGVMNWVVAGTESSYKSVFTGGFGITVNTGTDSKYGIHPDTSYGWSGEISLGTKDTKLKIIRVNGIYPRVLGGTMTYVNGACFYTATSTAINAARFIMNTGNIQDGEIRMYGLRDN